LWREEKMRRLPEIHFGCESCGRNEIFMGGRFCFKCCSKMMENEKV